MLNEITVTINGLRHLPSMSRLARNWSKWHRGIWFVVPSDKELPREPPMAVGSRSTLLLHLVVVSADVLLCKRQWCGH